jgi:hypothetical protein
MDNQKNSASSGGWDDPAGAGISVMREESVAATPRSVAIGVAHLPAALSEVQPDEVDAAVDLALSRMATRADGELANVRAAVDQSTSVIVLTADVRPRTATDSEGSGR